MERWDARFTNATRHGKNGMLPNTVVVGMSVQYSLVPEQKRQKLSVELLSDCVRRPEDPNILTIETCFIQNS